MLGFLQRIGRSLMLPIAVLPAAGLLLRIGALLSDPTYFTKGTIIFRIGEIMAKGGGAIFDNLPILFAVGVALGLTDSAGAAALAAVAGYLVMKQVVDLGSTKEMKLDTGVVGGLITGFITAGLYNRYHDIRLPDWLQFFGGKRFIPIVTSMAMVFVGILFLFIWPPVQDAISAVGNWLIAQGSIGLFIYGVLNRLLLMFGLHHILNSLVWFTVGDFVNTAGQTVHGDLTRFFAGDKTAGMFMTGFFPILMFALPAACLAMIHEAKPEKRQLVSGVLISSAIAAFLTGITEPIEFAFMFVAPLLYVVHALLTGVSMAIVHVLGIKHGFTFSAGAIDFFLNLNLATKPWLLFGIGLIFAVIYYVLFRVLIRAFNIRTPGREDETDKTEAEGQAPGKSGDDELAREVLEAIGGKDNIDKLDACTTRLRMTLKDENKLDQDKLKKLGAAGVVQVGKGNFQAVFGTKSELLKDQILKMIERGEV
ncbi:N-acetylglucosamine-specific PTS transporter subunit IIBC [Laceyella putida]|uniref:N-acetylglucosamine-specific PTS transporter subunit IIBC n=1 Tax=Laceyella putida TaxID=110101 RepID=A0ABW2RQP0_9BACL